MHNPTYSPYLAAHRRPPVPGSRRVSSHSASTCMSHLFLPFLSTAFSHHTRTHAHIRRLKRIFFYLFIFCHKRREVSRRCWCRVCLEGQQPRWGITGTCCSLLFLLLIVSYPPAFKRTKRVRVANLTVALRPTTQDAARGPLYPLCPLV